MSTNSINDLLQWGAKEIESASDSPLSDARLLISFALNKPKSFSMTWPEHLVSPDEIKVFRELIASRRRKVPIAYLVGSKEFWSINLTVSPGTLIPRPETELLVEKALEHIPNQTGIQIIDLGTGSGAIAFALATEKDRVSIDATDFSLEALEVAEKNRQVLNLTNVVIHHVSQWYPHNETMYDVVISNPPYVACAHENLSTTEICHEPLTALAAGPDGLDAIDEIVKLTPSRLKPGGWLMMEHGFDQREAVSKRLINVGFENIVCHQDLAGLDRVTAARLPKQMASQPD